MSMPLGIQLIKRSHLQTGKFKVHKAGDSIPPAFVLIDNEDTTMTVSGTNESGDVLDIASVATIKADSLKSSDETVATADSIDGMTVKEHGLKPGAANITFEVDWNDASVGPFEYTDALSVSPNPAVTGLVVTHGTPVVRVITPPSA